MSIIYWIWCFPQMFLAYFLRAFVKVSSKKIYKDVIIYKCNLKSGSISLGNKIFLCKEHWDDAYVTCHEYGHCKQSLMLGWFYLLVIGLPSFIWCNCFNKYRERKNINYYNFFTEKWANKLGGIDE